VTSKNRHKEKHDSSNENNLHGQLNNNGLNTD